MKKGAKAEIKTESEIKIGKGNFLFGDGSKYNGEWKEIDGVKVREGNGTISIRNESYTGQWENDSMNGIGEYHFASGAKYKGQFKNNLFEGEGVYFYPDNAKYEGNWKSNKMHGTGVYLDGDGSKYEGQFINGMYDSGELLIPVRR